MGAELRMFYKNQRGQTANVTGRAVGSTGSPDGVRVLVQGQKDVPDGIYGASTSSVRVAEGFIPDEVLKEQGIENTVKISKEQEALLPTIDRLERADITDEDLRLINEGANSKEGKQHAEYKKSVEAAEKAPSTPKTKRIVKASRKAVEDAPDGAEFFYSRGGKLHQLHVGDDGFLYKGPYVEGKEYGEDDYFGSYEDIAEANAIGRGPGDIYKGRIPTDENFNKLDSAQFRNLLDEQAKSKPANRTPKAAIDDMTDEEVQESLKNIPPALTKAQEDAEYVKLFTEAKAREDFQPYDGSGGGGMDVPGSEREKSRQALDAVLQEVMGNAAFGDDIPSIDSVLRSAKDIEKSISAPGNLPDIDKLVEPKTTKKKEAPSITKKRYPIELEPGMVVREKGVDLIVQDTPKKAGATSDGRQITTFNFVPVGKKNVQIARVDSSIPLDVVVGPDGKTPIKNDVVSPEVAKPTTPATPTKPKTPKPPTNKKARIAQLLKKYKDDGKDIAPAAKSREELWAKVIRNEIDPETGEFLFVKGRNGKPRPINAVNAIEDAIFEENPNAKIMPNGAIVIERSKFTDTDGKEYAYEIRVQRTKGNQFMERYIFSDPKTKEVLFDFYNHDYKETFNSLYGKSNGVVKTRDFFLGRDVPGSEGVDAAGVPNNVPLRSNFGPSKTLKNRIAFLLQKKGAKREPKIITPEDNRNRFLDGHGIVYNKSDSRTGKDGQNSTLGTVARSFVPDIYELVASKDVELIKEAFKQAMGRMPDTDEDITALVKAFQEGIRKNFAGSPDYASLVQLPRLMAAKLLEDGADIRDDSKVPFVSQDGVTLLVPGSYVQFFNNQDGISVGRVVRLIAGSGPDGRSKDTVAVKFADKTVANLQTRNMKLLTDEELDLTVLDNDNLLSPYVPQLQGDEMREIRLGIDYRDALNRKEDSPDDGPDDILESGDAGAPYIGEAGVEGNQEEAPVSEGTRAEDLSAGDPIYSEDGELLGTILAIEEVPSADGGDAGYAVTYESPDGEEEIAVLDAGEVRGPK
jgi:hypothetical protein